MQVTNIRVSFMREKQPAQYEKAQPAVEFTATLDDGEDHRLAARRLMIDATAVVYAGIGYDVPTKVAQALASDEVPIGTTAEIETTETTETTEEKSKKKTRGRPKGSKNTMPKKGTKAAKTHAAKGTAAKADDGLPPEDDETPNISTGEARVGPEDDPADHGLPPEDETGTTDSVDDDFTAKDLHTMIHEMIKAKRLSVPNAKQVLAHFKVARAQDLTPEQAVAGRAMVEKMIEAGGK